MNAKRRLRSSRRRTRKKIKLLRLRKAKLQLVKETHQDGLKRIVRNEEKNCAKHSGKRID